MRLCFGICLLVIFANLSGAGQTTASQPATPGPVSVDTVAPVTAPGTTPPNYVRPNAHTRFKRYLNGMFGPVSIGKVVFSAGTGTWRNAPTEWGRQWNGFGKRVASGLGKGVINSTVAYGLEESFALDGHFYKSRQKDLGSRLKNALISPFTARTRTGRRVFGFPHIAGTYTANIVAAETWYPSRYGLKDGLKSGTWSLGMGVLFSFAREFILSK